MEKKVGEYTTQFDMGGGETIVEHAVRKNDHKLLTRIRGIDLFSVGAHYHPTCRKAYAREGGLGRSKDEDQRSIQLQLEVAHNNAFREVCNLVETKVIKQEEIVRLSDLCEHYINTLQTTDFENPEYRADKLKRKLEKHDLGKRICFVSFENTGKYTSQLIYSQSIKTAEAIQMAYKLGSNNSVSSVAATLRTCIKNSFSKYDKMSWPPTAEYLKNSKGIIPEELERFLKIIISGKDTESVRVNRLALSIGQYVCRAATNGHWSLPKHISLCTTLRHMFRSKELITLINRFGHCESYSFSLELETAVANAVQASTSLLPKSIVCKPQGKSLFHSEFDNFDKLVNDLYGSGSVHTAHGIMLQETKSEESSNKQTI